jgi:hypothetical protein
MNDQLKKLTTSDRDVCLNLMNFFGDWESWKSSLRATIDAEKEMNTDEEHVRAAMEDMLDFLAERVCPGSKEEELFADMWSKASPQEREVVAELFLKVLGY